MEIKKTLLSLRAQADRLKLPVSWLRAEALAGRIPCLKVGRRLLFNPDAVERSLLRRAEGNGDDHDSGGTGNE